MTSLITKKFAAYSTFFMVLVYASLAFAQGEGDAKAMAVASNSGLIALGAGLGIGMAAIGAAFAQGRAASTALDGIARNPGAADRVQGAMIIGLALIESIMIFAFLITLFLTLKF